MPPHNEAPHLLHPKYRPDIDGLRAIAVVSVLGFHAFPSVVRGGFIGVDIFFVISGFLISTIIFGSLGGEGFSYREFYERRVRRIFPALLPVLAATFAFGWYVLLSDEFQQLGKHMMASAGFVQNLVLWGEAGYFDTAAEAKPLLHLWSLAVEEQFYIFWPLLLGLVWRWKGARGMMFWMSVAAGLSFLLNVAGVHRHADATFYSPLSRVWELAAGALLAHAGLSRLPGTRVRGAGLRSLAGLVLIVLGLAMVQKGKAFPGWWALLPILGACLCISAGMGAWPNRMLLGSRPLVWIGLISYPLYLWHWPVLAFARIVEGGTPMLAVRIAAVAASVALAWLTYRFIEQPIRKSKGTAAVRSLVVGMLVLATVGAIAWSRLLPPRNSDPALQAIISVGTDWGYPGSMKEIVVNGQPVFRIGEGKGKVLLLGDSHVEQYGPRAIEIARTDPGRLQSLYFATRGACPPIPNLVEDRDPDCPERVQTLMRFALSPQIDTVVLGGCWPCYFDVGPQPPPADAPAPDRYYLREGGVRHMLRGGDGVDRSFEALAASIRTLKAAGKKVFLVLNMPVDGDFQPKALISGSRLGAMVAARNLPTAPVTPSQQAIHDRLQGVAEQNGAIVIDPMATLCTPQGQCTRADAAGVPIYKDLSHLRATWVKQFATFFDAAITQPK
ncbi:acyltransferase family protein [Variovorax sp. dw_308]|uniref:acyltransferase family protein n=1 Tax=Variovorax sp. dw_308 TaxID=2721546 RepID=UPI001C479E8C|nr:acyltransferase family protein [Variovorax sp. dw_308]